MPPRRHSEDDRREAVRLYREGKMTVEQIAEGVNASRSSVYSWLQMAGAIGQPRTGEDGELAAEVALILDNQIRFMEDIDGLAEALGRIEQHLLRLTGAVEILAGMLRQLPVPPSGLIAPPGPAGGR